MHEFGYFFWEHDAIVARVVRMQDLSDANDYYDSEEPELTLRWSMTEVRIFRFVGFSLAAYWTIRKPFLKQFVNGKEYFGRNENAAQGFCFQHVLIFLDLRPSQPCPSEW